MTGKTHKKAAIVVSSCTSVVVTVAIQGLYKSADGLPLIPLLWPMTSVIGGYAPDVDKGRTTARTWFNRLFILYTCLAAIIVLSLLFLKVSFDYILLPIAAEGIFVLLYFMVKFSKHRRESHSLLFVYILWLLSLLTYITLSEVNLLVAAVVFNLAIGVILGVISHIVVDEFNIDPMHIFFPLEIILGKIIKKISKSSKKAQPIFIIKTIGKIKTSTPAETNFMPKFTTFAVFITAGISSYLILKALGVI